MNENSTPKSTKRSQKRTPKENASLNEKPLTPERIKDKRLATKAIEVALNNGTLEDIATSLPERFEHLNPDSTGSKRQHVYERLQKRTVQEEMSNLVDTFDLKGLADATKRKLRAIVDKTKADKPSAPQAALMTTALKLSGDLVERNLNENKQTVDLGAVKAMSKEDKTALLLELIRLESSGVSVRSPAGDDKALEPVLQNEAESPK